AAIARRMNAAISLVHVREDVDATEGLPEFYPLTLRDDLQQQYGIAIDADIVQGDVQDALLEFSGASGSDLIVMTSSGRGGWKRAVCGSVADAMIRRAHVPVLLAKEYEGHPL